MKRVIGLLLAILLLPSLGIAQAPPYIRNDSLASINGPNLGTGSAAVDVKGQLFVGAIVPGTGATNLGKAESTAHASGDVGVEALAVRNTSLGTFAANNEYTPIATGTFGQPLTSLILDGNLGQNTPVRVEDSAAASGDALVGVAGVIQTTLTAPAANGDYAAEALGQWGETLVMPVYDQSYPVNQSVYTLEDSNHLTTDGGAGAKVLAQTQDPLSVDQGTTGDAAYFKVDRAGRLITTLAPAGETFVACSGTIINTTDTEIKAAVASNRIYVTSVSCTNSSSVATVLRIKDGSTTLWVGGIGNSTLNGVAYWSENFNPPLRGTSNTALNAAMATTATNTICCASGYISVN